MEDAPSQASIFFVAALIATAGLWWFRMVLKKWLLSRDKSLRFGLYALIWLAYFVLIAKLASA